MMWDIFLLIVGAVLGVIAAKIEEFFKRRIIIFRNQQSLREIPEYNPQNDDILLLRQWNSNDRLDKVEITYEKGRKYDLKAPKITCSYITAPEEWNQLYADELKSERKRTGAVSYVTFFSPDHKDTENGDILTLKVSTCDYLAHDVNIKYLDRHPEDWMRIKQVIKDGNFNEYFSQAMPGNVFVNYIVINGQTNNVLAIKRSNQELNGRNIWGLSGFETMSNVANVSHGSEEKTLKGITFRGLWEELALRREEVAQMSICSLSFVKHLGIMVTVLVRVDLGIENSPKEGEFIRRVLEECESLHEHSDLKWLPLKLEEMKNYIKSETGFYEDVIKSYDGNEATWIDYAKFEMYQIWYNHESIGITL